MLKSALAGTALIILLILLSSFLSDFENIGRIFNIDYPLFKSIVLTFVFMAFMIIILKLNMQYKRSVRNRFWLLWQMKNHDEKKITGASSVQEKNKIKSKMC